MNSTDTTHFSPIVEDLKNNLYNIFFKCEDLALNKAENVWEKYELNKDGSKCGPYYYCRINGKTVYVPRNKLAQRREEARHYQEFNRIRKIFIIIQDKESQLQNMKGDILNRMLDFIKKSEV